MGTRTEDTVSAQPAPAAPRAAAAPRADAHPALGLSDIVIRGAREHNLQNLTLRLPRERLIVISGGSGSGKSSLAFDTLYAEGQRRYVESSPPTPASSWARWRSRTWTRSRA